MIHFVLGGARSGKSRFAEQQALLLAQSTNKQPTYIATATAIDNEMAKRITKHQLDRKQQNWQLIECPLNLSQQVIDADDKAIYLIDCLTLWLNNLLFTHQKSNDKVSVEEYLISETEQLIQALNNSETPFVIVSNEVGLGIIPMGEQTRLFVDYCGWLNQKVAAIADQVTLVTAGLPLVLKSAQNNGLAND